MGWIIFYLLCVGALFRVYRSAQAGYQTKDGFFFGVQKSNNKEQHNEKE